MNNDYTVTLHIGKHTETSFGTQFKMVAGMKGDNPFKAAYAINALLDKRVLEKAGLEVVLDINGVFIPNNFKDKSYTVEEAYKHASEFFVDSFFDMLKDALTGGSTND